MSNDWQWNSPDWRLPGEDGGLDQGLGSYPTLPSSGYNGSAPDEAWEPVSLPPPPPTPPPFSSYGRPENPYGQPTVGSYPFAPVPVARSRPRLWFLVPVFIFVVVCAGGGALAVYGYNKIASKPAGITGETPGANTGSGSAGQATTLPVNPHPTIMIDRNAGAVQIEGVENSRQVVIQPTEQTASFSDGPIPYTRSGDGNTITFDLDDFDGVDVLLKVPAESNLNITTNGDAITVTGVKGQQVLSSNGGSLRATQVTLTGNSTLDTNAGSIVFSGALDSKSVDHFNTNSEPITITLPANAAFHVDISNNGGTIRSDFSQVAISDDEAHGDVGPAPRARVEIDSNGGTIQLKKG